MARYIGLQLYIHRRVRNSYIQACSPRAGTISPNPKSAQLGCADRRAGRPAKIRASRARIVRNSR